MPKISAPTVAEHRSRQRALLIESATALLLAGGVHAVTPAAVGAAAGLARPSVYQYFGSGADIIAAIIEDSFPRVNAALSAALEGVEDPREVVAIYISEALRVAAAGEHRVASILAGADLPAQCRQRIGELHFEQMLPFLGALGELGVPDLRISALLLGGAIEAAMNAVESGEDLGTVTARTLALVDAYVASAPVSLD